MIHEYDGHLLKDKVRGFKLQLPVYIDNDHDYWNALQAHAWPSLYLIDKNGLIRYVFLGETHKYFVQARTIEKMIRELSQEQSDPNKQKK